MHFLRELLRKQSNLENNRYTPKIQTVKRSRHQKQKFIRRFPGYEAMVNMPPLSHRPDCSVPFRAENSQVLRFLTKIGYTLVKDSFGIAVRANAWRFTRAVEHSPSIHGLCKALDLKRTADARAHLFHTGPMVPPGMNSAGKVTWRCS